MFGVSGTATTSTQIVVLATGSGTAGAATLIGIVVGLAIVLTLIGIAQARDPDRRPAPPFNRGAPSPADAGKPVPTDKGTATGPAGNECR